MGKVLNLHFTDGELKALEAVSPLYAAGLSSATLKNLIYDRLEDEYDMEIIREYEKDLKNGTLETTPFSEVFRGAEKCINYTHKRPFLGHCAPPLQKPSQSVCAFGLTSWGFMVD